MTLSASTFVRRLDVVILVVAFPIFLAADLPLLGWAATTVAWIAQLTLQQFLEARAREAEDTRQLFGFVASSLIGRSWLLALTIFGVGIFGGRDAGLAAAVLALVVFTVYLLTSLIMRPTPGTSQEPTA